MIEYSKKTGSPPENNIQAHDNTDTFISKLKTHYNKSQENGKPYLNSYAFTGLAGEFVGLVKPHTEADPVGILIQFITIFGALIGRTMRFVVGATRHHGNLFTVLVGRTSKARKGTSLNICNMLFEKAFPEWFKANLKSGLSSGEGLIYAIRDPVEIIEQPGKRRDFIVDQGVEDKRLLIVEEEFAQPLKIMNRDGNILSTTIRNAWDSKDLSILTKNNPTKASSPHIAIIAHITIKELKKYLSEIEAANGFGNRFCYFYVERSQNLPLPKDLSLFDYSKVIERLRAAVSFSQKKAVVKMDEKAEKIWCVVYSRLVESTDNMVGYLTARAESQVLRFALVFAVLDCNSVVKKKHLLAALALWEYSEASCRYIFGDAIGDSAADMILAELKKHPQGLTKTEIQRNVFKNNKPKQELKRAYDVLFSQGLAYPKLDPGDQIRSPERWFAVNSESTTFTNYTTFADEGLS